MVITKLSRLLTELKPFRTSMFAVIIAVLASFGVTVVSSLGKQIINKEMTAMGMDSMTVCAYNTNGDNLTDNTLYDNISNMSEVINASPVLYETMDITFSNGITAEVMGWGIDNSALQIITLNIIDGRMFTKEDIDANAYVCVVDKTLVENAYKRTNINGKKINITVNGRTIAFTVIGTMEKSSGILNTMTGSVIPDFVYIPYTTMQRISTKSAFDQIIFTSKDTNQTATEFKQKLVDLNRGYQNKAIKLTNLSSQKENIDKIVDIAFLSLFAVSCIAVIVCSVSVASSVNTAVISKQKDIGIKISMGASQWDIAKEFLLCAITSCVTGVTISFLIMVLAIIIINNILSYKLILETSLIVISIFATIILTAMFSLIPSCNAAKMSPIKALNRE